MKFVVAIRVAGIRRFTSVASSFHLAWNPQQLIVDTDVNVSELGRLLFAAPQDMEIDP
jgi:hypothetical protein